MAAIQELWKNHRNNILRFGPPLLVEIGWWIWALMDSSTRLGRFNDPTPYVGDYYFMSITMIFGSMVAGATSEGGGAIAFPVMTLVLGVPPLVARDFSFAIQSFGMTCAAITIFGLRVPVDYEALIFATIGGAAGLALGLIAVAPYLPPPYAKLLFVSVWMTFAVALFKLNARGRDRRVYKSALESDQALNDSMTEHGSDDEQKDTKVELTPDEKKQKQKRCIVLFFTGIFGGLCSAVAGSGIDIASFSILTLFYRVSEKVATPTSVVLMAINAILGMCFRFMGLGGAYSEGQEIAVWNFVSVCVPIVVLGAPLGATISARLPRHWLAYLIYFLDTVQFVSALVVIRPWSKPSPTNIWLCVTSGATLIVGSAIFFLIANAGSDRGEAELKSGVAKIADEMEYAPGSKAIEGEEVNEGV
eukprot:CAMPEP_0202457142 /NCGR_PEP_ID=MMETSP1360-20130828/14223_1 /ASSEMBLY_ACC=CAM_ASM_000848 /TAXON_ID=515479 /ORGANISM="Licmophora paradoxa, Strain CCMP2313" /LENGTH=417 /DNA_ID=CAMNT_0049077137 /DNA_START=104 /DNA_END=1357 /DNA_ORIENTATION=-